MEQRRRLSPGSRLGERQRVIGEPLTRMDPTRGYQAFPDNNHGGCKDEY